MTGIRDYDGVWHRLDRYGVDTAVVLCGMRIRPDFWSTYTKTSVYTVEVLSASVNGEPVCGECWY